MQRIMIWGVIGEAYYDVESANYHVSTGNYTAWNSGWNYRNDGVDIEVCADNVYTNGYNVGFLDANEWMQYEVDVAESGVYEIRVRTAAEGSGGSMHFAFGDADITHSVVAQPTGGWQTWETTTIPNVIIDKDDTYLKFYVDRSGFNVSSFEFIKTEIDISSLTTEFVGAITIDEHTIKMNTNKFIDSPLPGAPGGFEIFVEDISIPITEIAIDPDNPRIIRFSIDYNLKSTETIKISYSGSQITATDGTELADFSLEDVKNTVIIVHQIPGRIQAEDFDFQSGIVLETSTDVDNGKNIGFLDIGDYLDYEVNIPAGGNYIVDYRTAGEFGIGGLELQMIDAAGNVSIISNPSFAATGGWQTWTT